MLLVEFPMNIQQNWVVIKYRDMNDDNMWHLMEIDIETLHLLLSNFGIIGLRRMPMNKIISDNGTLSPDIKVNFCGASITMPCCPFALSAYDRCLPFLVQDFADI